MEAGIAPFEDIQSGSDCKRMQNSKVEKSLVKGSAKICTAKEKHELKKLAAQVIRIVFTKMLEKA